MTVPHARALDVPGWPSPPAVADIPNHPGSWGYVWAGAVVVDARGCLWVDGAAVPMPTQADGQPIAAVAWHEHGIALWLPAWAFRAVEARSVKDERWLPVAVVLDADPGLGP